MRSLTSLAMIVMLGAVAATARAQDDLDLLLGELTFPDSRAARPAAQSPSASAEASGTAGTELVGPGATEPEPASSETSPQPETSQESEASPQPETPQQSGAPQPSDGAGELRELPPAGGQDLSLPVDPPQTRYQRPADAMPRAAGEPLVDPPAPAGAPEPVPAPRGAAEPSQGTHSAGHGFVPPAGPSARIADTSYHRPNLPPPSTLHQYFNSKPCYRDLWSGYGYEAQKRCHQHHKHLHGTCDCFEEPYSPPVYRAERRPICRGCDSPKCSAGR